MSLISQRHNTDSLNLTGSHNQVHIVGRDSTTITHHYDTSQETVLAALKPVDRSAYYVTPCMPGTRQWIIDQIHNWLNDVQAPNILWLSGGPGAGKSTIASTLVSQLAEMGRLGSSLFFKRGDIALSDPAVVWRTVAFDLAQVDHIFAGRLMANLKERKVDLLRADIESHFKYLIEDPLTESWNTNTQGLGDDMNHTYVWDTTRLMQANNLQDQACDFMLSYLTP
jgi:hypothetical protein